MGRFIIIAVFSLMALGMNAQDRLPSSSMWLKAYPVSGAKVPFDFYGEGVERVVSWGMDVAWNSSGNVRRGANYIGNALTSGRISFQPSDLVGEDLVLSSAQQRSLRSRCNNIKISGVTNVIINCDHEALNSENYYGKPVNWYRMIKASVLYARSQGLNVTSVLPFNEPDYTAWGEGSQADFKEIARLIKEDPEMEGIRVCGGNTLNCDQALSWYNYMKPYIDEGNTHQLAGGFSTYAGFFTQVRKDGKHATADEMHNTMEALVATHYGLQTGIWWGYDGVARGDFCKAAYGGHELGYGENRSAWAAGCVYRLPNGAVEAFIGVSERQANKNWMDIIATDCNVYFDGYGPVRLYQQFLPGDGVYSSENQRNADKVIHIHSGEDVPLDTLGGEYIIMNKSTMRVLRPNGTGSRAAIQMADRQGDGLERWKLSPTSHLKGMDFSYHYVFNNQTNMYMNLLNNNLNEGGSYIIYNAGGSDNEQYVFEYAGDGYYYIRNHLSGLYLTANGNTNVQQYKLTNNNRNIQMWRLMPVDAKCEIDPPAAPTGLKTEGRSSSILLSWDENTDPDFNGYMIFRENTSNGETVWETIGRNIKTTQFLDNDCMPGKTYKYRIRAVDLSGNRSEPSQAVEGVTNGEKALIAHYEFDDNIDDESENQFDAKSWKEVSYSTLAMLIKSGTASLNLDGSKDYLLLPNGVGMQKEMTISFWLYNGDVSRKLARAFDFGADADHCMYFTPNSGTDSRFVIKNGETEQVLSSSKLTSGWKFVAVTFDESQAKLYVNGEEVASEEISLRPSDINAVTCYIGRGQAVSNPLFKGRLDNFSIYNYAQTREEIRLDMNNGEPDAINSIDADDNAPVVATEYYTLSGERTLKPVNGVFIMKQRLQDGRMRTKKIFINE